MKRLTCILPGSRCCLAWRGFAPELAAAKGHVEHAELVVWDERRPDFVTPRYTPALRELAGKGVFLKNHQPLDVSTIEMTANERERN
jgi:hypothetical protein